MRRAIRLKMDGALRCGAGGDDTDRDSAGQRATQGGSGFGGRAIGVLSGLRLPRGGLGRVGVVCVSRRECELELRTGLSLARARVWWYVPCRNFLARKRREGERSGRGNWSSAQPQQTMRAQFASWQQGRQADRRDGERAIGIQRLPSQAACGQASDYSLVPPQLLAARVSQSVREGSREVGRMPAAGWMDGWMDGWEDNG